MSKQDEYDRIMTRRILWKLDSHILPPLALLWLANFIDRSNVGNAKIAGLDRDAHLHGNQFNTALAVFYVTYLIVEVPSNIVLKKLKPNRWIPFLVFVWGIVTTLTALVHNFGGLVAIRLCLGFCEGGLLPGMILYLSTIYKRHELQLRVGIFYASASLSGAFGGLLATAIIKMDGVGGLAGWRWIFILEGLATIVASLISAWVLPADVSTAKFLSAEERAFAIRRFQADLATPSEPGSLQTSTPRKSSSPEGGEKDSEHQVEDTGSVAVQHILPENEEKFEWGEVMRGLTDIQTWLTGVAYCGLVVSLYSYSLFLPTIVTGLGYKGGAAQLHTVPPYVPAVVLTVIVAILSDRLKWRGPFILICLPLTIIGNFVRYIIAITAQTNGTRYIAVFFMAAGVYPSGPCILSILPNNSSGHYKKATTTALQLAIANTGGFIATFAYTQDQAPKYIRGHSIVLAFTVLSWSLIGLNVIYCLWENKARREGRRQGNLEGYKRLWDSGKTRAPIGDRHPEFMYTL
ncbi:MFS general substrate transporter [Collybia nuda]|uniref:MFS general substrate transporter n=1 Tax=Collybia nuda TaxID=64659 RepID=A0A9P5Y377_9AGAR|nr:MFS general substrate transporter [Collybia nuda]